MEELVFVALEVKTDRVRAVLERNVHGSLTVMTMPRSLGDEASEGESRARGLRERNG